ncbi:MAG: hypothetical protein WC713_05580, partial [Candidatus Methylomirabilota bacterium]
MSPATPDRPISAPMAAKPALDVKLASTLIVQLNILRKNTKIYPDGHPALLASVGRTAKLLHEFFARTDTFALAVAKDALLVGQHQLPRSNPIVAEFATHLHDQSIYALSLKRGIAEPELAQVARLISGDTAALPPDTPLPEAISQASRGHAEIRLLDWSGSEFSDEAEIDLTDRAAAAGADGTSWESFIRRLLQRGDEALLAGEGGIALSEVNAEKLARLTDRLEASQEAATDHRTLTDYLRGGQGEADASHSVPQRLQQLSGTLSPDIRAALTGASRLLVARSPQTADTLLHGKEAALILKALEDVNSAGRSIDPRAVALVESLAEGGRQAPGWPPALERPSQEREFSEHVQAFLTVRGFPSPPESANPAAALRKLEEDLAIRTGSGQAASIAKLLADLQASGNLEHYATTLLDLLSATSDPALAEGRARKLAGLLADQAHAGRWGIVLTIWRGLGELEALPQPATPGLPELCRKAKTQFWNPEDHPRLATAILTHGLDQGEFLADILRVTGRTQAQQIVETYAQESRESALAPLLPLIVELKEQTMPHVLRLLEDKRPAVVTRMLQLLQRFGDPAPLRKVESLAARADREIKLEALRTLASLGSPKTPQLIVRFIGSADEALSLGAIAAARLAPHPEVIRLLLAILADSRWFKRSYDLDRKIEAARSLIGMGNSDLLSGIFRAISRRPFFHVKAFHRLRLEVFRALARTDLSGLDDFVRLGRAAHNAEIAA